MAILLARDRDNPQAPLLPVQFTLVQIATLPCKVPVIPGGDGADTDPPTDLSLRTARCRHTTNVLVGLLPTCTHHLRIVLPMLTLTYVDVLVALDGPVVACDIRTPVVAR